MHSNQIPKWIVYFGTFLGAFGLVVGAIGIFNPVLFFNDFPDGYTWVGAAVVIAAGLLMVWRDRQLNRAGV